MSIKRTIKHVLRPKNGKHVVYMQLCYASGRKFFATKYTPTKEQWDADKQEVAKSYTCNGKTSKEINRELATQRQKLENIFAGYEVKGSQSPTIEQVADEYNKTTKGRSNTYAKRSKENKPVFVVDLIRQFIDNQKVIRSWTRKMEQQFENLIKQVDGWREKATTGDLTEDGLATFVQWLTSARGGNLQNTTAKKRITQIKDFLKWANQSKTFKNDLYETFAPKFKQVTGNKDIVYLTREELHRWIDYTFKPQDKALERIRDVFTFLCFTGMRYSDVLKLKHEDITEDRIHIVTKKTSDSININLNDTARAILDKYKDFDETLALPCVATQPMNNYLKKIAELMGIDAPVYHAYYQGNKRYEETVPKYQVLSTHAGRRTFVVTAITLGMDLSVIMKFTGHSSLSAMKPYMDIVDELKQKEMNKFNEF